MALSTEYYNLPGGEMALGLAPLLSQLAAQLNGGNITPQAMGTAGSTVGTPVGAPVAGTNPREFFGPGTGGGQALGNVGGAQQLGASMAAGNTAVNPSLASAGRLALNIAMGGSEAPIEMLGGLAASELLGGLGLGDLSIGGISLGNPFNVAGPSLNQGQLQSAIAQAISQLGPNPSQVAVSTAINNVIQQARAQASGFSTNNQGTSGMNAIGPGVAPGPNMGNISNVNMGAQVATQAMGGMGAGTSTANPGGVNTSGGGSSGGGSSGAGSGNLGGPSGPGGPQGAPGGTQSGGGMM